MSPHYRGFPWNTTERLYYKGGFERGVRCIPLEASTASCTIGSSESAKSLCLPPLCAPLREAFAMEHVFHAPKDGDRDRLSLEEWSLTPVAHINRRTEKKIIVLHT